MSDKAHKERIYWALVDSICSSCGGSGEDVNRDPDDVHWYPCESCSGSGWHMPCLERLKPWILDDRHDMMNGYAGPHKWRDKPLAPADEGGEG